MEKIQETSKSQKINGSNNTKPLVWDCGSSLYDSFELKSFERQLYSAIHSRTLSMPHLAGRRLVAAAPEAAVVVDPQPPPPPPPPTVSKKSSSRISRSFQKFLKSVFKSKQSSNTMFGVKDRFYDNSGALSTIPEVPEIDLGGFSPEINSLTMVRRTGSERFTAATSMIGISCA